ncbi:hypothetical protein ACPWSR_07325 [Alloiococcus sp. CFN-8]|uniref:hypothetical protein n=1 Tax=Alloiococcus sp. CFN-8 TaxID=3416081 RepID=UPI003CF4F6CC
MKNYFNIKLYKEGLKKVRLLGIAAAMVSILLCSIIPIINMVEGSRVSYKAIDVVTISEFAVPLVLIMFITPLFVISMFSYLNERSKSDFYHSIPYKRTCVYFSFLASILTWLWGIIIATTLITGILWTINPLATFSASVLFLLPVIYILATTMIAGFFTIAMTLTGTPASNIAIGILLMTFVRITGALFTSSVNTVAPIFDMSYSIGAFLEPTYFLPIGILASALGVTDPSQVYSNIPMLLYSLVISIALLTIGAILYKNRKSEMAGKSAPSKLLQNVYRCAITLPFALALASILISSHYREYGIDIPTVFIFTSITLLVYYLYELITTKNVKNMLKATPYLLVVAAGALLFTLSLTLIRSSVLSEDYSSSDIATVAFYNQQDNYSTSFEDIAVAGIGIQDSRASEIIAASLKDSIEAVKNNSFYDSSNSTGSVYYQYIYTEIQLASNKVIGRYLRISEKDYNELIGIFSESKEYKEAYLSLPSSEEVSDSWIMYLENTEDSIWKTFQEEYKTLSNEDKLRIKQGSFEENALFLDVTGESNMKNFHSSYLISQVTPKTLEKYLEALNNFKAENINGTQKSNKERIVEYLTAITQETIKKGKNEQGELNINIIYNSENEDLLNRTLLSYDASEKEWTNLMEIASLILEESNNPVDVTKPFMIINVDYYNYSTNKEDFFNGSASFNLSEANMEKVKELLK